MTVAHVVCFFRSHLAQVTLPLRVTSLSWASATATQPSTRVRTNRVLRAVFMVEPPLCGLVRTMIHPATRPGSLWKILRDGPRHSNGLHRGKRFFLPCGLGRFPELVTSR